MVKKDRKKLLKAKLLKRKKNLASSSLFSIKYLKKSSIPLKINNSSNKINKKDKIISLSNQHKNRLKGAQFRMLNEYLYINKSSDSFQYFQKDPKQFRTYHNGFISQTKSWPINPIDIIIKDINNLMLLNKKSLKIGDFGCGDAKIAKTFKNNKNIQIYSYDLISELSYVISCDISHVNLKNNTLDIAIYCLSLMGNNFLDFS